MSSWAALKEHVVEAGAEHDHALAQVRWVFGRYAGADAPGWTAPSRGELSEHFTERFLALISPESIAKILGGMAARLSEALVVVDADSSQLRAKLGDLRVEAAVEPEAPHRLDGLRVFFAGDVAVAGARVARPPSAGSGPVPGPVPGLVKEFYAKSGLAGLTAAGGGDSGSAAGAWTCSRGWADVEGNVPLGPGHRFPACQVTALVTATAVLCLVAAGVVALDDRVDGHLRSLRLAGAGPGRVSRPR